MKNLGDSSEESLRCLRQNDNILDFQQFLPSNPFEAAVRMTRFLYCHSEESPGGKPMKNLLMHIYLGDSPLNIYKENI
jgi:hypothetical protein